MGLKDVADQEANQKSESEKMDKVKSSILADEAISGSFYFLFGCVFTWMKLNGHNPPAPQDVMTEFQRMKSIEEGEQKEFLENSDKPLHNFLYWYFYER